MGHEQVPPSVLNDVGVEHIGTDIKRIVVLHGPLRVCGFFPQEMGKQPGGLDTVDYRHYGEAFLDMGEKHGGGTTSLNFNWMHDVPAFPGPGHFHAVQAHFEAGCGHTTGIGRLPRTVKDVMFLENSHRFRSRRHISVFRHADATVFHQLSFAMKKRLPMAPAWLKKNRWRTKAVVKIHSRCTI